MRYVYNAISLAGRPPADNWNIARITLEFHQNILAHAEHYESSFHQQWILLELNKPHDT